MKQRITLFCLLLCPLCRGEFFTCVAPDFPSLGTTFESFKKARPAAVDLSGKPSAPGLPFSGDMTETLPDRSMLVYYFYDDRLDGASWMAPPSAGISKQVTSIRDSLWRTCGKPAASGTTGRIKSRGEIARIVWEQYRPTINTDYAITIRATSESGIEVDLINLKRALARGRKTVPLSYEEVVQSVGAAAKTESGESEFTDLLFAAGVGSQEQKESNSHDGGNLPSPSQEAPQLNSTRDISSASGESSSFLFFWVLAMIVVMAIGCAVYWKHRRR